jgi:putative two-component system response regulator
MEIQTKRKLLIVDDIQLNRLILSDLFSSQYEIIEAENGRLALERISEYGEQLSIILLDIIMPELDGFGVLKELRKTDIMDTVPVILITGENDDEKVLQGYELGVADIINKPFNPEIVERRVSNVVALYSHKQDLEQHLQEQKEMLESQAERLRQTNMFMIDALTTAVEFRSFESGTHNKRIRLLTEAILVGLKDEYQLDEHKIETMSSAAALHDIGKIAIPDAILLKPGSLTHEEFEVMKTHTTRGAEILASLNYTQDLEHFTYCYDICRHHHERWDGRGYPDGLKGEEIPIWAQAASVADVYDALTSKRIYKGAYTHSEALTMIQNGECGVFNPKVLHTFAKVGDELRELSIQHNPTFIVEPIRFQ